AKSEINNEIQMEIEKKLEELGKKKKKEEYPYLEKLSEEQRDKLKENKWIVCDPGKKCLLYIKDENDNTFKYTNAKHIRRTKREEYQMKIQQKKDDTGISIVEESLSMYNKKTCQIRDFMQYISWKNYVNVFLMEEYQDKLFRQLKWYSYINRQRAEERMIKEVKEKYSKDTILIMGDWSDKCGSNPSRLKYMSTPNVKLKRRLNQHFRVYNIDEYRTSCLHDHIKGAEERCENLYLPIEGKLRKMHSILTCQMPNGRWGC